MIALLSREETLYSTRVLHEAAVQAGHEVLVLDVLELEVKLGEGVFWKGDRITPSFVLPRLTGPVVLAGVAVLREWERLGVPSLNCAEGVQKANCQLTTLQLLSKAGLPIPDTTFCSQPADEETYHSILSTETEAHVIKLLDSSQGRGVSIAPDHASARSFLSTLAALRSSGLTQPYYAEAAGKDHRLLVLDGEVIGAIQRKASPGEFRANVHQGGTASTYAPTAEERELALKAADTLGLRFAGVDLLPTLKGSVVLEVNSSPGLEGVEQGKEGSIASQIISSISSIISAP